MNLSLGNPARIIQTFVHPETAIFLLLSQYILQPNKTLNLRLLQELDLQNAQPAFLIK